MIRAFTLPTCTRVVSLSGATAGFGRCLRPLGVPLYPLHGLCLFIVFVSWRKRYVPSFYLGKGRKRPTPDYQNGWRASLINKMLYRIDFVLHRIDVCVYPFCVTWKSTWGWIAHVLRLEIVDKNAALSVNVCRRGWISRWSSRNCLPLGKWINFQKKTRVIILLLVLSFSFVGNVNNIFPSTHDSHGDFTTTGWDI